MRHELKTDPEVFEQSFLGLKNFEIRFNDRDFQLGDMLVLKETKYSSAQMADISGNFPLEYTERELIKWVKYILHGDSYGLADGWVILSV